MHVCLDLWFRFSYFCVVRTNFHLLISYISDLFMIYICYICLNKFVIKLTWEMFFNSDICIYVCAYICLFICLGLNFFFFFLHFQKLLALLHSTLEGLQGHLYSRHWLLLYIVLACCVPYMSFHSSSFNLNQYIYTSK